jgi:hypothetical protein
MLYVQNAIGLVPFSHAVFYEHFYYFCHGHFVNVAGLRPLFYNAFTPFHVLRQALLWRPFTTQLNLELYNRSLTEILGTMRGTPVLARIFNSRGVRRLTLSDGYRIHTIPLCMVETVTRNAGVVSYPIHPYVTCNARLVSTSENV